MTAINWLIKELNLEGYDYTIEQAKQMERQQIIDAFKFGEYPPPFFYYNAEQYYDETYGSKGSDERIVEATKTIISQTEISDEEIEKAIIDQDVVKQEGYCHCFLEGAKWYREQLKSK